MDNSNITEVNITYPFNDLLEYRAHIDSLATTQDASKGKEVVFNDSVIHASMIMGCILNHSKKVNMFCGKFSVFREAFREKIQKMLNDSSYDEVRTKEDFKNFTPFDDSIKALYSFFERGGIMNVILEDNPASLKEEPIWNNIKQYIEKKQLFFFKRNENAGKLSHFATGDTRFYRWENNQQERTALCSFYDSNTVDTLNSGFEIIKTESKEYSFN